MERLLVVVLLLVAVEAVVAQQDAGTSLLRHIVDRIVHRYEEEDLRRRVCGTETISMQDNLLIQIASNRSNPQMNVPVCCAGYARNATTLRCEPVCRPACRNARCVAPDLCYCLPTFARSLAGHCVPTCPTSCLNGRCYGNQCVCDPGFTRRGAICVPQCQGQCTGGNCTAPNVCVCNRPAYVVNNEGNCEPFCAGGCINGKCSAPNVCTCMNGYMKNPDQGASPNVCVPDCFNKCVNGYCTGPGHCTCYPGYTINKHRKFMCIPHCQPPCVNGTCTAPGVCTCKSGHFKKNNNVNSHVCVPSHVDEGGACWNCTNGMCSGGRCLCYDGYQKDRSTGRCLPRCSKPCEHGNCTAPNTCSCEPGYTFDFYKKQCQLSCSPPCQNGACANGNTCVCNPGYARDTTDWTGRKCLPLCDPFCINGVCSSPNKCICNPGFVKDTSSGYKHICVPGNVRRSNTMTTRSYG